MRDGCERGTARTFIPFTVSKNRCGLYSYIRKLARSKFLACCVCEQNKNLDTRSTCRHYRVAMADVAKLKDGKERQIVGFSITPVLAREVKQEAARRGMSLRKLFEEMWGLYKTQTRKTSQ